MKIIRGESVRGLGVACVFLVMSASGCSRGESLGSTELRQDSDETSTVSQSQEEAVPTEVVQREIERGGGVVGASRGYSYVFERFHKTPVIARVTVADVIDEAYGYGAQDSAIPPTRPPDTPVWFRTHENTLHQIVRLSVDSLYKGPVAGITEVIVAIPMSTVADEFLPRAIYRTAPVVSGGEEAIVLLGRNSQSNPMAYRLEQLKEGTAGIWPMSVSMWFVIDDGMATCVEMPNEQYEVEELEIMLNVLAGIATPVPNATPIGDGWR